MKIAVVDYYRTDIIQKDPAQITLGLLEIGEDVTYIARNFISEYDVLQAPFRLIRSASIENPDFWRNFSVDVVLVISRLAIDAEKIISAVKAAELRLILKADSDGTLGYPLVPNYLRTLNWWSDPIRTLFRNMKWRLPIRRYVGKKIDQIIAADAVIVESPKAHCNITTVLNYWGYRHLTSRVYFVPNPVASNVLSLELMAERQKIVLAVGRWEDVGSKNTEVMVRSLIEFLKIRNDYRAIIVGSGAKNINNVLKKNNEECLLRLSVLGSMDHDLLVQQLANAQILFMPSRMESFGIVAAEALCVGCSIAVTPVESLEYLTANGFSGTVSSGFDASTITEALIVEAERWSVGEHSSLAIAEYWRPKLERRAIAAAIRLIAEDSN